MLRYWENFNLLPFVSKTHKHTHQAILTLREPGRSNRCRELQKYSLKAYVIVSQNIFSYKENGQRNRYLASSKHALKFV